jgi:hypothetical protein
MSDTFANYGGRQPDNVQNIKQFVISSTTSVAVWIYKKIANKIWLTPANSVYDVYIGSNLYVVGIITSPSDVILKENISDIKENEYDNILKLEPQKYSFIDDKKHKTHYGIMADKMESYFPELTNKITRETDDCVQEINTVNYIELIPIMICKMKKMQTEIDELKQYILYNKNK